MIVVIKRYFEQTILYFRPNLPKEGTSGPKQKMWNTTIKFCIFELVYVTNLILKFKFFFWVYKKKKKKKNHHQFPYIQIRLCTQF